MKQMRIKKLHRLCSVRGCSNKVTYAISRSREIGSSVILCADCMRDALSVINKKTVNNEENTVDNTETKAEIITDTAEITTDKMPEVTTTDTEEKETAKSKRTTTAKSKTAATRRK